MPACSVMLALVLAQVAFLHAFGQRPLCPRGHFYSNGQCQPCSICPMNTIIITPCSKFYDLICGPFIEPDILLEEQENGAHLEADLASFSPRSLQPEFPTTLEREDDQEYWKTLAFVLIGLMSVLILGATVVVLVACRKLYRATRGKHTEDGDADDTDSGYVVIHSIRNVNGSSSARPHDLYAQEEVACHPPLLGPDSGGGGPNSRQEMSGTRKLCLLPRVYTPQRWLVNYDTDDVFESDDSGGSMRRAPQTLARISEKSEKSSNPHSTDSHKESV